jgi:hypothetical protein
LRRNQSPWTQGVGLGGEEDVLAGKQALRQALLVVIAEERVHGLAVGGEAVGPPVLAEQRAVLREELTEPGGHHGHVLVGDACPLSVFTNHPEFRKLRVGKMSEISSAVSR